jgi:hypothetical protein
MGDGWTRFFFEKRPEKLLFCQALVIRRFGTNAGPAQLGIVILFPLQPSHVSKLVPPGLRKPLAESPAPVTMASVDALRPRGKTRRSFGSP